MPLLSTSKLLAALLAAGWLAEALAGKNSDIEAGIAAYTAGDHDAALASYAAAEATLGERPEIFYNRGLALVARDPKDESGDARKAFERGTESTNPQVHASSEYELGNLDLDAEAFDAAIERYTKCLKSQPTHAGAKWNLELALLKKKQKEEEEEKKKKEQEEQDKQNQDENKDEDKKDENKDEDKKDEDKKDEPKQDEPKQDEQKKDEPKQDEPKQDEQKKDEPKKDEQKKDEQKGEQPQPQPQPQPLDKADLAKALEQLDAEDPFVLGRPGRPVAVEKDW